MKKMIRIGLSVLTVVCLFSCHYNSPEEVIGRMRNKKIHDSLAASGEHGFYCTYFIVGKVKTMQIFDDNTYKVEVSYLDPALEGKDISLKLISGEKFLVSFNQGDKTIVYPGIFGENAIYRNIHFKVEWLAGKAQTEKIKEMSVPYMFRIHGY